MTTSDAQLAAYQRAYSLLCPFVDPQQTAQRFTHLLALKPAVEDFAQVFVEEVVDIARTGYTALWSSPQPLSPAPDQTLVELQVASGEDLQAGTGAAAEFPGGYAEVAHLLRPEPYWVCWRFSSPGLRGPVFYDGLVLLEDRAIWLPKPWRILPTRSAKAFAVAGHFDD